MKVITLTLCPAFDVHCDAPAFSPFSECFATRTSRDAGGKGVNISRALKVGGVDNVAFVVLGEENADEFREVLAAEGLETSELVVGGRIRENLTLHTRDRETRISFAGFSADETLLLRLEEKLLPLLEEDVVVTLTGRIPDGIAPGAVKAFLSRLRMRGVRTVIDSKSFLLSDVIECRPWLIKPNEEEISQYLGKRVDTLEDALSAARGLSAKGIENVMISLGGEGAVLSSAEREFFARAPKIEVRSTVGAGDSAIAGFLTATARGASKSEALRLSVAFGSAACLTLGTQAPCIADIETLFCRVCAEHVSL